MAKFSGENFLIATTMLATGLFAIISWDSTFPDRRDVLILSPLPVPTRTMFGAKVSAVAASLGLIILVMDGLGGLTWPLGFNENGFTGFLRLFLAYWGTMLAAGAFIYSSVLAAQGITAQLLPRRLFLKMSSFLQTACFCLFVAVYFLQPVILTPEILGATMGNELLGWVPSFWFLGLFQELNGNDTLRVPAERAWLALSISLGATIVAYTMAYWRTLRRIVEEPDIAPGVRGGIWLPRFGGSLPTAITQFSIRGLLRSRQHRILLAFYMGVAFAMIIYFLRAPGTAEITNGSLKDIWHQVNMPVLAAGFLMMGFCVGGIRVVFSVPMDLRANWIFRALPVKSGPAMAIARRRAYAALSVGPVLLFWCAILIGRWPPLQAIGHLLVLGLAGIAMAEVCLCGKQKIPFTCSYLPGKSNFHITFWVCMQFVIFSVAEAAEFERDSFGNVGRFALIVAGLAAVAGCARWRTSEWALTDDAVLRFEEEAPVVQTLGLTRDGPTIITPD